MMSLSLLLAAMVSLAPNDSILVSAKWLQTHRSDPGLIILHVGMDKAEYDRGHVPGARWVDPHSLMSMQAPGVELPAIGQVDSILATLGVTDHSRIVYYGDTWMAPRVFLALEYAGLGDRVALLDGGLGAWRAAGGQVTNETPTWQKGAVTPHAHPEIVVTADWLKDHLADKSLVLLDGRSAGEYSGTDESERLPRFGHIPGGVNVPWEKTFTNGADALDGTTSPLRTVAELKALFEAAGVRPGSDLITYCTVGLRASHLYFVARYLGYHPRIYDGSMTEWSRKADLPMVKGANPR